MKNDGTIGHMLETFWAWKNLMSGKGLDDFEMP